MLDKIGKSPVDWHGVDHVVVIQVDHDSIDHQCDRLGAAIISP
jgi:hypothetical protein